MAKKFTSRDKVVNKMTKDGLEELNVTKGTKENISNRIKDISLERKKDKLDLKTDNLEKNANNKRQKRQQKIIKNQSESVDSYSKVNNPGYEKGSHAASSDKNIRNSKTNSKSPSSKANMEISSTAIPNSSSIRSSSKYSDKKDSTAGKTAKSNKNKFRNGRNDDALSFSNSKIQVNESRFKLKNVSDKAKLDNKMLRLFTSSIRNLEHTHNKTSLKHNSLKAKQRHGLADKFEDAIESDDNSLQSDTFKTVRSTKQKLQKGVRYINNRKRSKENIKYKEEIAKHKKKKHNSKLKFEEHNVKKAGKFLLGAGSHSAKFSKDSALESIEQEKSLQADTSKFLREGTSIASTKINSIRKFSNLVKKSKTQRNINKGKSALNQKNKEVIRHNKKRNVTKLSSEERKKLQKDMYKKQYAKSFKSSELQKTSEAIQINQNRFIAMLKSSKAAMVRVVTAISSLVGLPFVIAFLVICILIMILSTSSLIGATFASIVYQSSDLEVTSTNSYFSELETELAIDIFETETRYSGYDEYEYSLDNISHDPHMIASYLSVKFPHGFELSNSEVKMEIENLFKKMYKLERIPRTEVRYSGETSYTVEILKTVLKTKPLEDVIDSEFGVLGVKEKISYRMFYGAKGSFTFMKTPVTEDWKLEVIKKFGYSINPDTNQKEYYNAMDIILEDGKVYAVVDGTVYFGSDEFGQYLEILTYAGNKVRYSNLTSFTVLEGQEVKAGAEISSLANTTTVDSFLRLQLINKENNFLDPYFYLISNTDKLSDAYIVDFSQNNGYNNNPNYDFPSDVDFESYEDWVKALLEEAKKHLGKRYVFGSNGPNTFDCSSFVTWTFTHSGVKNMPRTTAQGIYNSTERISKEELRPGDIVFFTGTYDAGRPVTHVGIYVGDGTMIHAGDPVQYANLNSNYWKDHYYGAGRVIP
ncbi:CD1108 family mobile element protein [Acetoanaerobium noterae]|nr:NlpC/P60 family protein [Acetoanaerobium noterae]